MIINKIKRMIFSLLFLILLIGCGKLFRFILVDDTASYTRITFHEMYAQDNIDILFVGSSHCYRSFVPDIFDKKWETNSFNGGTSAQCLDGSYTIIKEAVKYHDIKHIYLELYYNISFVDYKTRTEMTQTYIIADYLRPSLDKIQYLLNASAKDHYPNSFILARRNWSDFFDADYIRNLIAKKRTDDYMNYTYTYITTESEWYVRKGYVANKESIKDWNYFSPNGWNRMNFDNVSEDWICSLNDIISFCNKKDISLTLVSAPMPNYLLASMGNYDEYIELFYSMIEGTDVEYYDFNLCYEEYFPNTSYLFKDTDHLNCYGAELFSNLFADFIDGKISKNELFYSSYDEKLKHLEPTIFGISYSDSKNNQGEQIRNCKIVSTENEELEYEISILPAEGELYTIQDFSNNKSFSIATEEHGIIIIVYRLNEYPKREWKTVISY